ncbi:MAG TPA: M12 family metallo-peptidase [Paucimonas sp.]|nr:M12 family metallo-peptidase [Paucimonas sp.]
MMRLRTFQRLSIIATLGLASIAHAQNDTQNDARNDAPRGAQAPREKPAFPSLRFNDRSNGEKAVRNLGAALPAVAAHYGKTPEEFRRQLLEDRSVWLDKEGRVFFVEAPLGAEITSGSDLAPPGAVYPLDQTFFLHSRPSSKRKIYLDFNGHRTSGTSWNRSYGVDPIVSPAFDLDGIPSTFNSTELGVIQNVWRRVAEDYAPFDVDVTTEEPPADQMTRLSSSDLTFGVRVVITKNFTASTPRGNCGCGGFAYLGVFDSTSESGKPAFVFYDNLGSREKAIAEAVSHEAGHTVGLSHDGTSTTGYYSGHGTGPTGWAPIMGVGYSRELVQFSKGEYYNANNKEDDFAMMHGNGVSVAVDDFGNTFETAATLAGTAQNGLNSFGVKGVVESPADLDVFRFTSGIGTVSISATPFERSPNLDIVIRLHDASGNVIASANPLDYLNGSIGFSVPTAGTYYLSIRGTGKGNPLSTGYTAYGSIGRYAISVSAPLTAN